MDRRDLNQSQVAAYIGVEAATVNRWVLNKTTPSPSSCAKLAELFGEPVEKVYQLAGHPISYVPKPRVPLSLRDAFLDWLSDNVVAIPIHEQAAAAGIGQAVLEYAYWEPPRAAGRNIVGLRVRGASMEPEIQDGDTIFIDRDMPAEPGKTVVATVGDEVVVKKLRRRGGKLVLSGKTGDVSADDAKIEGVVIQLSREVN